MIPNYPTCDACWYSVIPMFFLGISYTSYAVVLWGSIPYLVEGRVLGTAFGIFSSMYNLGTVISPPLEGYIF